MITQHKLSLTHLHNHGGHTGALLEICGEIIRDIYGLDGDDVPGLYMEYVQHISGRHVCYLHNVAGQYNSAQHSYSDRSEDRT